MKNIGIYAFFIGLLAISCTPPASESSAEGGDSTTVAKFETIGEIEVLDPAFNDIVKDDAKVELLATGFNWSEGPLWLPEQDFLIFTDVPENTAYKWSEEDSIEIYLQPSGYFEERTDKREPGANGLFLDNEGKLNLCQHGARMVAKMNAPLGSPESVFDTLAWNFEGKKFNSPNDLAIDNQGRIYFTDPPYGLDPWDEKEIDFQGVYRIDHDGTVSLLIDSLFRPNGIGLSPDHKTLYVCTSDGNSAKYYAYQLNENGGIASGKVLLDVTERVAEKKMGVPDGMTIHKSGTLFATGPEGILVISPEGKLLGVIKTGNPTANCAFDEDFSTLYITSDMNLLRVVVSE